MTSYNDTANLYYRKTIDSNRISGPWRVLLSDVNYTSYTVTKTGSGASGTWGINISGNAASASSVAWGNITGKPDTYSPSSHSHNNYLSFSAGTNYVAARFHDNSLAEEASDKYIELWQNWGSSSGWFNLKAGKFITVGGTSSHFVKGDGTLDNNTYSTASHNHDSTYLKLSGGIITNTSSHYPLTIKGTNDYGLIEFRTSGNVFRKFGIRSNGELITTSVSDWSSEYLILHSGNYTDYTVKKDGTGASGTWGINISGNAGSASTAGKISSYSITGSDSFLYRYSANISLPIAEITSSYWYVKVQMNRQWCAELTKCRLSATYSNTCGFTYLDIVHYNGKWRSYTTDYCGTNIVGIASTSEVPNVFWIKLNKPIEYGGTTPDGSFEICSQFGCTLSAQASEPSGVTFTSIKRAEYVDPDLFTELSNSGNNIKATIAGISRELAVGYASRAGSIIWENISEKPSEFTPASHTHNYINSSGFSNSGSTSLSSWGTLKTGNGYTGILNINDADGGSWEIAYKNGQQYHQIDGYYYQNEGSYRVTDVSETVTALGTSGNNLTWTKNGTTNNITVPYATAAGSAASASSVSWSNITSKPINLKAHAASLASNGWKNLNGRDGSPSIAIAYNNSAANWNSETFSATMVWGCSDTRGMIDCGYNSPIVTFGGSNYSRSTDDDPSWYFKLQGTSGTKYNLDTSFASASHNHSGVYSEVGHTHSYLPLSGGTLTGGLIVSSTSSYRAEIDLISAADVPNDLYWGNSGSKKFSISSRGSDENNDLLFYSTSAGSCAYLRYSTGVFEFKKQPTVNGNSIWHAGNDGSGSGLDADTLDGQHASGFISSVSTSGFGSACVETSVSSGSLVITNKSYIVGLAGGASGAYNYLKLCTIIINGGYQNRPIVIEYGGRSFSMTNTISVQFGNVSGTDPDLTSFKIQGLSNDAWIVKDSTSNWSIYIHGREGGWADVFVHRFYNSNPTIAVSWTPNTRIESIPTGATQATWGGSVGYAVNATSATNASNVSWSGVSSKPDTATRWPAWSEVTSKPTEFTPASHSHNNYLSFTDGTNYVAARFHDVNLAKRAASKYIEFWQSGDGAGWFNLMAGKFMTSGGNSSQFVKGDGSLDSNSYALSSHSHSEYAASGHSHSEFMYRNGYMGDFNANNAAGVYFINPSATNKPDGDNWSNYGICLVAKSPGDTCAQLVWDYSSGRFEVRVGNNSGSNWQSWRQVMYTDMTLTNTEIDAIMV